MINLTQNSFLFIYFSSLRVSSNLVLIIRRINCINTTSGICHSVSVTVSCAGRKFVTMHGHMNAKLLKFISHCDRMLCSLNCNTQMRVDFCAENILECCNSYSTCTLLRSALFFDFSSLQVVPKRRCGITNLRCIKPQKSAELI